MYAIKVWLNSKKENEWYLMRDMHDGIVHCYGRKSRADDIVNKLKETDPKLKIEVTKEINGAALKRSNDKRAILEMENKE